MGHYLGPKLKLSRRLGVPIAETPKHAEVVEKGRRGRPRMRRQRSLYARQMAEKQKLSFYYNIGRRQLRRYLQEAQRSKESTADALIEIVESRLDNVLRRLGWARTIWQARQMVSHGHIKVNGRRIDRPSYPVQPNDVIAPVESSLEFVKACAATAQNVSVPAWLALDENRFEAQVVRRPKIEDVQLPFDLDCGMIVELFSK